MSEPYRYFIFHKPQNTVTARSDSLYPCIADYLPSPLNKELHPLGRLDKNTEGLLILTDNGALDVALLHPEYHVSKTYFLYAFGNPTQEELEQLRQGVKLHKGHFSKPAGVRLIQRLTVKDIEAYLNPEQRASFMKNPNGKVFSAEIIVTEGKKHQIKEMLKAVHCTVAYLKRTSIGEITLDNALLPGEYRECTPTELAYLQKMLTRL